MGKESFNKRKILLIKNFNRELKKRIVKTTVWSVSLHTCETWKLKQNNIKKLEAFEMWLGAKIEGIKWQDHITNEEVLNKVGERRSLINTITRRQKNWIGHVLRGNNLIKKLIEGRLYGKKRRGKPRHQMLDFIMERKAYVEMKRLAQDRKSLRKQNHRPVNRQIT